MLVFSTQSLTHQALHVGPRSTLMVRAVISDPIDDLVAKLLADRRSRWMGTVVRHTRGSA